jgi:hypothetical protein
MIVIREHTRNALANAVSNVYIDLRALGYTALLAEKEGHRWPSTATALAEKLEAIAKYAVEIEQTIKAL